MLLLIESPASNSSWEISLSQYSCLGCQFPPSQARPRSKLRVLLQSINMRNRESVASCLPRNTFEVDSAVSRNMGNTESGKLLHQWVVGQKRRKPKLYYFSVVYFWLIAQETVATAASLNGIASRSDGRVACRILYSVLGRRPDRKAARALRQIRPNSMWSCIPVQCRLELCWWAE